MALTHTKNTSMASEDEAEPGSSKQKDQSKSLEERVQREFMDEKQKRAARLFPATRHVINTKKMTVVTTYI